MQNLIFNFLFQGSFDRFCIVTMTIKVLLDVSQLLFQIFSGLDRLLEFLLSFGSFLSFLNLKGKIY